MKYKIVVEDKLTSKWFGTTTTVAHKADGFMFLEKDSKTLQALEAKEGAEPEFVTWNAVSIPITPDK
jgi:hypothetical protein